MPSRDELEAELTHQRDLHQKLVRNRRTLESQIADHGPSEIPLRLINDLRSIKTQLADCDAMITELEALLGPPDAATTQAAERELYLQQVIAAHSYLTFQGMLQTTQPVALPLAAVYVALRATGGVGEGDAMTAEERRLLVELDTCPPEQRERLEHDLEQLGRLRWSTHAKRVEIATALRDHVVLVVLGDPGSGKTTLLRYLALTFAEGQATTRLGLEETRLPILLPIGAYARALAERPVPLADFFAQYYAAYRDLQGLGPLFKAALEDGSALVLLDGLDEVVDPEIRRRVADQVDTFIRRYAETGSRIVVTSRIVGYRLAALSATLPHYTVLDFGPQEITQFAEQWCQAYEQAHIGDTAEALHRARSGHAALMGAITSTPGVERLAANPLLLTILALIHRQGKSLPRRRVELYDTYARILLERWNHVRSQSGHTVGKRLDFYDAMNVLAPLALWLHRHRPNGTARASDLQREVRRILHDRGDLDAERHAEQWLEDIRLQSALLVERGLDAWGFVHLTFQEYFAGAAVAMLSPADRWTILAPTLHTPVWHEVIRLAAGYLGVIRRDEAAATAFVEQLWQAQSWLETRLHRDLLLAATIVGDDVGIRPSVGHHLAHALAAIWWAEVDQLLAQGLDRWWAETGTLRWEIARLARQWRTLPFLSTLLGQIEPALTHPHPSVRGDAVWVFAMAQQWDVIRPLLVDPDLDLDQLGQLLLDDQQWDLFHIWVEQGGSWIEAAWCWPLAAAQQWELVDLVLAHGEFPDDTFREVARFLVDYGQWERIEQLLTEGWDHEIEDLVRALGEAGYLDRIAWALTDERVDIRAAAVWGFARAGRWADIDSFLADPEREVRRAVYWSFLQRKAWDQLLGGLHDPDTFVRTSVLRWLTETPYADRVRSYLQDADPNMRATAFQFIDPRQDPDLLRAALAAEGKSVQQTVLRKLAELGEWDLIAPYLHADDQTIRYWVAQLLRAGKQWTSILQANDDSYSLVRQQVLEAAAEAQAWDILWSALDDPERSLQQTALHGLVSCPVLTPDDHMRLRTVLKAWQPAEAFGTAWLRDVVTRYEETMRQRAANEPT